MHNLIHREMKVDPLDMDMKEQSGVSTREETDGAVQGEKEGPTYGIYRSRKDLRQSL